MPEYQVYLVGGAVRDELLGLPIVDRDWLVTGATPEQLLDQGYQQVGKKFPVFLHPNTKEEYALARTEKKQGAGYTGFICDFSPNISLEEDLRRRDLTINAIAKDHEGVLHDPYQGQQDINNRVFRHVSEAFSEDPLRVIRVARFAARFSSFDFSIAPETLALMQSMSLSGELNTLSSERVWNELEKALYTPNARLFFDVLYDCHALQALFAELHWPLKDCQSEPPTRFNKQQRWAYLCHQTPVSDLTNLCQRLRVPNQYQQLSLYVTSFLQQHILPLSAATWTDWLTHVGAIKRPQPYQVLVDVLSLLTQTQVQDWLDLREVIASVQTQPLVAEGLTGKVLGEAIRNARVNALESQASPLIQTT